MTPAELEAIRARDARYAPDIPSGGAIYDRRALLALVDELLRAREADLPVLVVQGRRMHYAEHVAAHVDELRRAVQTDADAYLGALDSARERREETERALLRARAQAASVAHLLAWQQARGIEGADAARRVPGLTSWLDDLRRCLRMYEEAWTRELRAAGARIPGKASGHLDELVAGTKDLGAQLTTLRAENERNEKELQRYADALGEARNENEALRTENQRLREVTP